MKNKLTIISTLLLALSSRQLAAQTNSAIDGSHFISKDSANKMISSYLNSIQYPDNDSALLSLTVNARELKDYLNTAPDSITHLKLILAHRLDYINGGGAKQPAGYNSNALTIILAGYDKQGNYVFYNVNKVLDYSSPCPPDCPPGKASSALIGN